jgi:ATP-binding cassette subfamily B (MDR/TAP) protein 1
MLAVVYVAFRLYKNKEETGVGVGSIATFLLYQQLLVFNFWMLSFVVGNVMGIGGGLDKITKIFNTKITINKDGEGQELPEEQVKGNLRVENVVFSYPEKLDVVALKGVSFEVNTKDKRVVALVGASGCGKSSSVAMMQRFYDPKEGTIYFNDVDIKELNQRWYHEQVAIVQQEPILFTGTIMENICYGLDEKFAKLTKEEIYENVVEACQNANAYEFIMDARIFPDAFLTQLGGPNGVKLSGG